MLSETPVTCRPMSRLAGEAGARSRRFHYTGQSNSVFELCRRSADISAGKPHAAGSRGSGREDRGIARMAWRAKARRRPRTLRGVAGGRNRSDKLTEAPLPLNVFWEAQERQRGTDAMQGLRGGWPTPRPRQ